MNSANIVWLKTVDCSPTKLCKSWSTHTKRIFNHNDMSDRENLRNGCSHHKSSIFCLIQMKFAQWTVKCVWLSHQLNSLLFSCFPCIRKIFKVVFCNSHLKKITILISSVTCFSSIIFNNCNGKHRHEHVSGEIHAPNGIEYQRQTNRRCVQ